jgi:toxin HigB-1
MEAFGTRSDAGGARALDGDHDPAVSFAAVCQLTYNVARYLSAAIRSFKDRRTEALYRGEAVAAFQAIRRVAARKLDMLDAATQLSDLRAQPGNRLEALKGERRGQHSIRINDQWPSALCGARAPNGSRPSIVTEGQAVARIRTHPGEVLREEFIKPLGLPANALALAL